MRNLSLLILLILIVLAGCEGLNNPEELLSDGNGTVGQLSFDQESYNVVWDVNNKPTFTLTLTDPDLSESVLQVTITVESSKLNTMPVDIQLNYDSPGVYKYTGQFYSDPWSKSQLLEENTTVTLTASYVDESPNGTISRGVDVYLTKVSA